MNQDRIAIGVSSCLLGQRVRYDGRDKRHGWIGEELARDFDLVAVCPEVGIGLGVPRPPIRLVADPRGTRAQRFDDPACDVTDALAAYAQATVERLGGVISGFIFKLGSPSCGVAGVPRFTAPDRAAPDGSGIFAATLIARLPHLPVVEEDMLADDEGRAGFIERVRVCRRWQDLCATGLSHRALIDFHSRHKLLLLARDEPAYRRLGRLVGEGSDREIGKTAEAYIDLLTEIMKKNPGRGGHVNALQHALGFLRGALGAAERAWLAARIEDYRLGRVGLDAPLAAIRAELERHPREFLASQHYLTTQAGSGGAE